MAFEKEVQDFLAEGTELPESKLRTGFVAGEKPPANWFNNLFYRMTQAVKELQVKSAEKEYVDTTIEEKLTEFGENMGDVPFTVLEASTENVIDFNTLIEPGIYLIKGSGETAINGRFVGSAVVEQLLFVTTNTGETGTIIYQALLYGHNSSFYKRMRPVTGTWTTWSSHTYTTSTTIPITGWSTSAPYYVDVAIGGVTSADSVIVTPRYTGTLSTDQSLKENWGKIDRIVTSNEYIRVYAFEEIPTVEIPIQIKGII